MLEITSLKENILEEKKLKNRIVLIQFGGMEGTISSRYLSGILKSYGFDSTIVTMEPERASRNGVYWDIGEYSISETMIQNLYNLCEGALLVGLTAFSFDVHLVRSIYDGIKSKLKIPVAIGGAHPTVEPLHSSFAADYVCVGDGEIGIVQLASALRDANERGGGDIDWQDCENIFCSEYLKNNEAESKTIIGKESSVDTHTSPDYTFKSEYRINSDGIDQITPENCHEYMHQYVTFFSRGCVYNCTFCSMEALAEKSGYNKRIKPKRVDQFIDELKVVRSKYPWAKRVSFYDPNILSNSKEDLLDILDAYKEHVDLPLGLSGFTFNQVKEDVFVACLEAGMTSVIFGIETGSEETKKLLERVEKLDKVRRIDQLMQKLKKKYFFIVQYDLILDIPWESSKAKLETLRFFSTLKGYDYIDIFSLRFFPGTPLFTKALEDGIIEEKNLDKEYRRVYKGMANTYYNFLFVLLSDGILCKKFLVDFLSSPLLLKVAEWVFGKFGRRIYNFYVAVYGQWQVVKRVKVVLRLLQVKGVGETSAIIWEKVLYLLSPAASSQN